MKYYFTRKELECKHCGEYHFNKDTLLRLNSVREDVGFPMIVSSGYRCEEYNIKIGATQTHATGQAIDIACARGEAFKILKAALNNGFTGIGISQKGKARFIHLDDLTGTDRVLRPTLWSY